MPSMFNNESFQEEFNYSIRPTEYWQAVSHAARTLSRLPRATIVQLGCLRLSDDNDWAIHGNVMAAWEWIAKESQGLVEVHAVDDAKNVVDWGPVEYPHITFHTDDTTARWIERNKKWLAEADLVCVDAEVPVGALSTLLNRLKPGCVVVARARMAGPLAVHFEDTRPDVGTGPMKVWRVR